MPPNPAKSFASLAALAWPIITILITWSRFLRYASPLPWQNPGYDLLLVTLVRHDSGNSRFHFFSLGVLFLFFVSSDSAFHELRAVIELRFVIRWCDFYIRMICNYRFQIWKWIHFVCFVVELKFDCIYIACDRYQPTNSAFRALIWLAARTLNIRPHVYRTNASERLSEERNFYISIHLKLTVFLIFFKLQLLVSMYANVIIFLHIFG